MTHLLAMAIEYHKNFDLGANTSVEKVKACPMTPHFYWNYSCLHNINHFLDCFRTFWLTIYLPSCMFKSDTCISQLVLLCCSVPVYSVPFLYLYCQICIGHKQIPFPRTAEQIIWLQPKV